MGVLRIAHKVSSAARHAKPQMSHLPVPDRLFKISLAVGGGLACNDMPLIGNMGLRQRLGPEPAKRKKD